MFGERRSLSMMPVIFILLFAGCQNVDDEIIDCQRNVTTQGLCLYDLALSENNQVICKYIPSGYPGLISDCLTNIAMKKNNIEICEDIPLPDERFECKAIISKDIVGCKNDTVCVHMMAYVHRDPELCKKSPYDVDYNRATCLTMMARKIKSPEYCELICSEPVSEQACAEAKDNWQDECYMELGIVSRNAGFCDKATDMNKRMYCLALVNEDASLCEKIPSDQSYIYNCNAIFNSEEPVVYDDLFRP